MPRGDPIYDDPWKPIDRLTIVCRICEAKCYAKTLGQLKQIGQQHLDECHTNTNGHSTHSTSASRGTPQISPKQLKSNPNLPSLKYGPNTFIPLHTQQQQKGNWAVACLYCDRVFNCKRLFNIRENLKIHYQTFHASKVANELHLIASLLSMKALKELGRERKMSKENGIKSGGQSSKSDDDDDGEDHNEEEEDDDEDEVKERNDDMGFEKGYRIRGDGEETSMVDKGDARDHHGARMASKSTADLLKPFAPPSFNLGSMFDDEQDGMSLTLISPPFSSLWRSVRLHVFSTCTNTELWIDALMDYRRRIRRRHILYSK
jgi:hypothetical protein